MSAIAAVSKRYRARSASDRSPDWHLWFVADRSRGGLNVTGPLFEAWSGERANGGVLTSRAMAELLADWANEARP